MPTLFETFWSNKRITKTGCWEWTKGKTRAGYGLITHKMRNIYCHRLAYEFTYGPVPEGLFVLHHCDNPSCINPKHLFEGTAKDNSIDALRKGRLTKQAQNLKRLWKERWNKTQRGENNPKSKLTSAQVIEMRRLHKEEGLGHKRLRDRFHVSHGVVQRILTRKTWKHV